MALEYPDLLGGRRGFTFTHLGNWWQSKNVIGCGFAMRLSFVETVWDVFRAFIFASGTLTGDP